jgi:DNA polymerase (family 10)
VLPELVTLEEIRGDLQMHTTGSDGRNDLAAMARAAQELRYEYIAVTDHSPAMRMVQGLDAAGFRRQGKRIDQLNARSRGLTILKGAEVDIGSDGSLDLDDATLAALDVVVASIHSHFDLSEQAQTRRIVRALQHPCVDILGHPTGRLLGERRGIRADWAAIFRAAADHGVMVEINAQPSRLDLDDIQARAAVEAGVRLVIDTDAHSTVELKFMPWGVDQARRGWVSRANVANTYPLSTFRRWLHGNR